MDTLIFSRNYMPIKPFRYLVAVLLSISFVYSDPMYAETFYWDNTSPYVLDSGVFSTTNSRIGSISNGAFIQNGGTHSVSSQLILGWDSGSSGSYSLNNGALNTRYSYVGILFGTGVFEQNGGSHSATNVRIGSASSYDLNGGALNASGTLLNIGEFNLTGGEFSVYGLSNTGNFNVQQGYGQTMTLSGWLNNSGNMNVNDGETVIFNNTVVGSGSFAGSGTKVFRELYQPGFENIPPPEFGDPISYNLANGAVLAGETILEETASLNMYLLNDGLSDWLSIDGSIVLDGELNISIGKDEYIPELGDSWEIIAGNGISGTFDNIVSNAPSDWGWEIDYFNDRVVLTSVGISSVPIPGALWLFGSGFFLLITRAKRSRPTGVNA